MVAAPWILPVGIWVAAVIGKWFEGIASTIKVLTHGPWKQTSCQLSVVKNSGPHPSPYHEHPCHRSRVLPTASLIHPFFESLE